VAYDIRIAPAVERALAKLAPPIQIAVLDTLEALAEEPRPVGCQQVKGLAKYDVFRVKVASDHRIIYQVRDATVSILVVKVADRKEVYRRLDDLKRYLR
jgi:mRNA interferase RelE/StbE